MPPKAKTESTELQVFNLDNLNPALLPELATFKEIQLKVVAENPFIEIVDTASRELAKKHRTARKTARTDLEKQDKLISSKFNDAKTKAKGYIAELIDMTYPGELKQQNEINRDEAELEAKRQEKSRIEQERVDNINKEINDYVASWKTAFNLMNFDSIEKVSADFLESYTSYDLTILEEFEALFPAKIEELTQYLADKTSSLTEAENARLEKLRIDLELKRTRELIAAGFSFDGNNYFVSDFKRLDMSTILSQSDSSFQEIINGGINELKRIADIETKRLEKEEEEKEAIYEIRKERLLEIGLTYSDEHDTIYVDSDSDYILLCSEILEESAIEFEKTISEAKQVFNEFKAKQEIVPEVLEAVIIPETIQPEKVEAVEILATELPTVNVCKCEEEVIPAKTTWESIENEFKSAGEKSYSKWLKDNYNPPTKKQ